MHSKYIKILKNNQKDSTQLFCLPYAGGNSSIYYSWREIIPDNIKLIALQLPGRAELFSEEIITNMNILIKTLFNAIEPYLDKPFAFFGHSMGGIIVYALTQYIEKVSDKKAEFIIISAAKPPHFYSGDTRHLMSTKELAKILKKNNATPNTILNSEELMDIIISIYRADCKLLETSKINTFPRVQTKVFIFNAKEDIRKNILSEWNEYFQQKITNINFNGGHFFIHKEESKLIKEISSIVNKMELK